MTTTHTSPDTRQEGVVMTCNAVVVGKLTQSTN